MLDAQGPVGTFTGAISLGFCPQTELRRPFCASDDLRYVGGAVQPPKPGRKSSLPKQPGVLAPSARLSAPWSWIDVGDSATNCSRSEEHTSELQSLMPNSNAVLCLKQKTQYNKR